MYAPLAHPSTYQGNRDEARPLFEKALAIRKDKLGEGSKMTMLTLNALKSLDESQQVGCVAHENRSSCTGLNRSFVSSATDGHPPRRLSGRLPSRSLKKLSKSRREPTTTNVPFPCITTVCTAASSRTSESATAPARRRQE